MSMMDPGPSKNEWLAIKALEICRQKLPLKSSNKKKKESEQRRQSASEAIHELRKATGTVSIESYGALVSQQKAGNCMEYACMAAAVVTAMKGSATVFATVDPGDHAFCAVGDINANADLTDIASFGMDVYICDPWANLACPAQTYMFEFKQKMEKWADDGKTIHYNGGWKSPTDKGWLNSLKYTKKEKIHF